MKIERPVSKNQKRKEKINDKKNFHRYSAGTKRDTTLLHNFVSAFAVPFLLLTGAINNFK